MARRKGMDRPHRHPAYAAANRRREQHRRELRKMILWGAWHGIRVFTGTVGGQMQERHA